MRGSASPSLIPSFSFAYGDVSPSESGWWVDADRQAGRHLQQLKGGQHRHHGCMDPRGHLMRLGGPKRLPDDVI